ncbi:ARF guanine-nucleotide exchange factor GNOM-like [Cornus florida]|uniref:ARF guanine-nucleotide exchange factor GNOM-like n=1 Tax=Cornus florida TaxID=4283 RepID=UPI00289AD444|nr:ARF guanine-nucleotide exchange factor GNOM-like [Cornus florida]XP_059644351.1 ARF guanine-nucleotide exchange factor GNOM-like [Cornus florida]
MGCLNQQSGVDAFVEPKDCSMKASRGALACMVNSEIGAVLAVMRRNVRWGVHYITDDGQLEHSLIQSFKELRRKIFSWQHQWQNINPIVYLQPFLDVIKSDETGAPITGVALSSIYKILTLEILDLNTVNVADALHLIVDSVTSCRFEVTDPASEEVVLMKILQVLLACMKSKASVKLSNQHVCNIINTCFRVVHQASSKGELLQRIARHTMHELVRCIFSHLSDIDNTENAVARGGRSYVNKEVGAPSNNLTSEGRPQENGHTSSEYDGLPPSAGVASTVSTAAVSARMDENITEVSPQDEGAAQNGEHLMTEPYGIPCMVEIFHFLCSLLNVMEHIEVGPISNPIAYDEDVPLFALGLINSAIELGGESIGHHPKLLALIQNELFQNLMRFGFSMSPLIFSTVCSIILNLYCHLRTKLKLQLEAFFSDVLLRIAQSKHGSSYQQQEVAMETLVDLCRQQMFMSEMYANFDCDISCSNVFEDLANLLSKSAFPVNSPLSSMQILALEGLIAMIQVIVERIGNESPPSEQTQLDLDGYKPFWTVKCENYGDPSHWVPFVHRMKKIKRGLMIGVDHFNLDPKKGLEFLQAMHLIPDKRDSQSVACFLRYTTGLDKNLIGDYLGNHDEFCVQVLHEFAGTFDFQDMNLDTALRVFLESFRLPGESQKIHRVLEAFSGRYYEQSPQILVNRDAALVLSYSLIMLNTDQHNVQVKKKMTEEDFIRNNRRINGGNDLPREYLSELYHSICENEIRMTPEQGSGFPMISPSHWVSLTHKSKQTAPFITCDPRAHLDYDIFTILSGPTIAAISVVFDHVEQEDVLQTCVDGFSAIAKISACYHLDDVLNDLVVSLCKFTTLMLPFSIEEAILAFTDDTKARMATITVFTMANRYGDYIRSGWKNILDCILSLHKLGLLPSRLASDAADELEPSSELERDRPATSSPPAPHMPSTVTPRKSSSLMGRFSQFLYLDTEEPAPQPTEEQLVAHQSTVQMVQNCNINCIFTESKFLQAESLMQLSQALILAAGQPKKGNNSLGDEQTRVFCLELLIVITLNNRDRIMLLWQAVYEHIANIVQSTTMPCALVEKAVFGLLRICQRLLPYKENLTDELLKSLQLILKLDARVADAYCEHITQEVMRLVKANAMQIRSHMGWRTIASLLSITARHPEASEAGFETLAFIMSDGAHLLPANYVLCVNAARQFAESRVGNVDRSVRSLDLMAGSIICLLRWSSTTVEDVGKEAALKMHQDIWEMWLRLVQGLRKVCLDQREEVRNHAILLLQQCLTGADGIYLPNELWLQWFDLVIFTLLDDLVEFAQDKSPKDYRNLEGTLTLSIKLLSKVFLQLLPDLSQLTSFCKLWLGVLNRMDTFMKMKFRGKRSEAIHELVPELLKNTLLVMKTRGILVQSDAIAGDSFWQLTWLHVKNISPSLQSEVFPGNELEHLQTKHIKTGGGPIPDGNLFAPSSETIA